jgi:hypothetical protein
MTFPANTCVVINAPAFSSVSGSNYCVEFFVKFDALNSNTQTTRITSGGGTPAMGIDANTSTFRIVIGGYGVAGQITSNTLNNNNPNTSSNIAFITNTWYHVAYMGLSSNTFLAINGRIYNQNLKGGSFQPALPDPAFNGTWDYGALMTIGNLPNTGGGAFPNPNGNIYISNFRMVSNNIVYSTNGFVPPTAQLTAISNTKILLANSTFRNEANGVSLTVTNTPTITTGDVSYVYPFITQPTTLTEYSNATSNSSTITYFVRSRGSGANQISKQVKSITSTNSYANATSNSSTITYFVRSIGSGANQISKQVKSIATANTYSNATSNSSTITYFVRSRGSGANQISKQVKSITSTHYDNDGRLINRFTWQV